ncbi:LuxR C-terminal-related transcriptional regulator [Achromobacter sp. Marseille-Q4962]|uniref:LuxR C-terminal-related transcriptional regulator n=1 Tax=Achromobacter sp. Marseille-Q4962 TaxID=2942202 RepID=UPI00207446DB|nr:LuxR C-terminal-related transcriptional regulator [Achromobacter sp. Marseille-Q4962]
MNRRLGIAPPQGSPLDYRHVFLSMPAALMVTRYRVICDCNSAFLDMFRACRNDFIGQTVRVLYPNQTDFERCGARVIPTLKRHGRFTEARVMQRIGGDLFWVSVTGFTETRDDPYREAFWFFSELGLAAAAPDGKTSVHQAVSDAKNSMTQRERDVAALLIQNQTAKEIGRALGISPRTVEVFRSKLLKKFNAPSTAVLVKYLLA